MKTVFNNQAFLFLSNKISPSIIGMYKIIENAAKKHGDTFLLFHFNGSDLPDEIQSLNSFVFSDNDLLALNYIPLDPVLLPTSSHFPLFHFYLKNPDYSYYWLIEDDVRFNGDWQYFFDTFSSFSHDFLSSHINPFLENPQWPWWKTLNHYKTEIPIINRIRSFNPVCRISNSAMKYLHTSLLNKWEGHHEVLIPTLLKSGGYKLLDLGGNSDYILPGFEHKFYTDDTMRFRPIHEKIGVLKNKLYHPIKD